MLISKTAKWEEIHVTAIGGGEITWEEQDGLRWRKINKGQMTQRGKWEAQRDKLRGLPRGYDSQQAIREETRQLGLVQKAN